MSLLLAGACWPGTPLVAFLEASNCTQLPRLPKPPPAAPLHTAGVFNEEALQGLDFVLDEAAKAGIYLTLVPLVSSSCPAAPFPVVDPQRQACWCTQPPATLGTLYHPPSPPSFLQNLWKANNGVSLFEQWCGTSNNFSRPDGSTVAPGPERLQVRHCLHLHVLHCALPAPAPAAPRPPALQPPCLPATSPQTPYAFYMSPQCRQMYKDYLTVIANR